MSDLSVVEYARHVGLAVDHREAFQQQLTKTLDGIALKAKPTTTELLSNDDVPNSVACQLADDSLLTEEEPLLTSKQSQILLSATSQPLVNFGFDNSRAWRHLLPDHKRFRQLKLEEPLLVAGNGTLRADIRRVKRGASTESIFQNWQERWGRKNQALFEKHMLENRAWLYDAGRAAAGIEAEIKGEKLEMSRECIMILYEALRDPMDPEAVNSVVQQDLTFARKNHIKTAGFALREEDYVESVDPSGRSVDGNTWSPSPSDTETSKHEIKAPVFVSLDSHTPRNVSIEAYLLGIGARPEEHTSNEGSSVRPNSSRKRKAVDEGPSRKASKATMDRNLEIRKSRFDSYNSIPGIPPQAERLAVYRDPAQTRPDSSTKVKQRLDEEILTTQGSDSSLDAELVHLSAQFELHGDQISTSYDEAPGLSITKIEVNNPPRLTSLEFLEPKGRVDVDKVLDYRIDRMHLSDKWKHEMTTWPALPDPGHDDILNENPSAGYNDMIDGLVQPTNVVTSDGLLWKPPGLKIFDGSDGDNEDIDIADINDGPLPQSNGTILDEPETQFTGLIKSNIALVSAKHMASKADAQACVSGSDTKTVDTLPSKSTSANIVPRFSAAASLSAFLDLRGRRFKKATARSSDLRSEPLHDPIQLTQKSNAPLLSQGARDPSLTTRIASNTLEQKSIAMPLPPDSPLGWPKVVVINNDMLQAHAGLVKYLESHREPPLTIIYRDFDRSDGRVPDIILGPTSCLVTANLQALTQKSLPGHKSSVSASAIHERMIQLSRKYEFVAVLVTCLLVSAAEIPSVTSVAAFCSYLSHSSSHRVQPIYILHKTSEELRSGLNAWIWALVQQHAFPTLNIRRRYAELTPGEIAQDETPPEMFLRRAGINAMAARVVLSLLKSESIDTTGSRQYEGVDLFRQMSSSRRLTLFSDIIGSEAIISVNSALNTEV